MNAKQTASIFLVEEALHLVPLMPSYFLPKNKSVKTGSDTLFQLWKKSKNSKTFFTKISFYKRGSLKMGNCCSWKQHFSAIFCWLTLLASFSNQLWHWNGSCNLFLPRLLLPIIFLSFLQEFLARERLARPISRSHLACMHRLRRRSVSTRFSELTARDWVKTRLRNRLLCMELRSCVTSAHIQILEASNQRCSLSHRCKVQTDPFRDFVISFPSAFL